MTNPECKRNCNQTDSEPKFLPDDKKKWDSAPMTDPAYTTINANCTNTDNKINKFVTVFAFAPAPMTAL